jgi:hypothetical protein
VSPPECFAWGAAYGVVVALAAVLALVRLIPPV